VLALIIFIPLCLQPFRWARGLSVYRLLPNSALIRLAANDPYDFSPAWGVLWQRTLSLQEKASLAMALLDRCFAGHDIARKAAEWLVCEVQARNLPSHICERYYRDTVRLWLEGAQTGRGPNGPIASNWSAS
jgi:hypothetical protein